MDSVEDTAEAVGCPIRKSTDQCLLAAPHGLSQRAASFIASQCQGIHQMPFRRLISTQHSPNATRRGKPAQKRSSRRCITTQPLNRLSHRSRHSRNPWCQRITLSDHPWSLILFTMSIDPVSAHPRRANTNRFSAETPPPCCQGAARSDEKGCGDGGTEVCGPRLP